MDFTQWMRCEDLCNNNCFAILFFDLCNNNCLAILFIL